MMVAERLSKISTSSGAVFLSPQYFEVVFEMVEKERYFACPICGDPQTKTQIDDSFSFGGNGLCDCLFSTLYWHDEFKCFEPEFDRCFSDYVEITKELYAALLTLSPLERYKVHLPESQLIKKPVYCGRCKEEIARGN